MYMDSDLLEYNHHSLTNFPALSTPYFYVTIFICSNDAEYCVVPVLHAGTSNRRRNQLFDRGQQYATQLSNLIRLILNDCSF